MTTTVIRPGRLVRVEPSKISGRHVLELAEALIEEFGHMKGDSGDESRGFSIHGAIGEAAKRITTSNDKGSDRARSLRDEAKNLVERHHNEGRAGDAPWKTEASLNDDPAVGKDEAIALIREAREAATN